MGASERVSAWCEMERGRLSLGLFRSENKIIKMQISRPALSKLTDWTVFLTYLIDVAYFPLFKHVGRKSLNFLLCTHFSFLFGFMNFCIVSLYMGQYLCSHDLGCAYTPGGIL